MKNLVIIAILAFFPFIACSKDSSAGKHSKLSKSELSKMVIIDVRTLPEWDAAHIDGAIHIPLDVITQEITKKVPDKNTPVALYCRSGRRSGIALNELVKLGYTNAENYGGMEQAKKLLGK